ncbi:spermatogenesis-associated protein 33 isoform X3 [Trachypithecus francoisi]|uniref:spermatogenesis-associated protein 33 isoform X3 n=1 Tax=Trachypithecus francoisi TaxID=54180 RepID=UPI00141B353D|nr:spermatogenesis-associated protein 33 isoform X3 [Trachypithecus francoisi]
MGLSKSKQKPRKGEEQKKGSTYSVPKPKDKLMEKHSQEPRQADRESEKPVDSLHPGTGTAKHLLPAASLEVTGCVTVRSRLLTPLPHREGS